jgi:hypothetical protein
MNIVVPDSLAPLPIGGETQFPIGSGDTAAVVVQYSGLKLGGRALPMGIDPGGNFLRCHFRTRLPASARGDLASEGFDIAARVHLVISIAA